MDTIRCYVVSLWHEAPMMLSKNNIVVSNSVPVVYSVGEGLYTISGYIARITDEYVSIILDSSFVVTAGSHPEPTDALISESIKNAISNVISKTMAIAKMETRKTLDVIVNDLPLPETTPDQLIEINKWIYKKLIVDYDCSTFDANFDKDVYFAEETHLSAITSFISKWDQYSNISIDIMKILVPMAEHLPSDADPELLKDVCIDLGIIETYLHKLKTQLIKYLEQPDLIDNKSDPKPLMDEEEIVVD